MSAINFASICRSSNRKSTGSFIVPKRSAVGKSVHDVKNVRLFPSSSQQITLSSPHAVSLSIKIYFCPLCGENGCVIVIVCLSFRKAVVVRLLQRQGGTVQRLHRRIHAGIRPCEAGKPVAFESALPGLAGGGVSTQGAQQSRRPNAHGMFPTR